MSRRAEMFAVLMVNMYLGSNEVFIDLVGQRRIDL